MLVVNVILVVGVRCGRAPDGNRDFANFVILCGRSSFVFFRWLKKNKEHAWYHELVKEVLSTDRDGSFILIIKMVRKSKNDLNEFFR